MHLPEPNAKIINGSRVAECPECGCEFAHIDYHAVDGGTYFAVFDGRCGHRWFETTRYQGGRTFTHVQTFREFVGS